MGEIEFVIFLFFYFSFVIQSILQLHAGCEQYQYKNKSY